MNISIPGYEILNLETESLVVSELGVSKIYSKPLLGALKELKKHSILAEEEINEIFSEYGLVPRCAFEFLEKAMGLNRYIDDVFFEKTVIVADWKGNVELEKILKLELSVSFEFRSFSDDIRTSVMGGKCFIVLICGSYNYHEIKKFYFELAMAAPDSAISVCYQMGDVFCIGQPYMRSIGNPCHFCSVDRVANSEKINPAKDSWVKILDICKNNHINIPSKPLTLYQELITIGAIARKIKFFTETGYSKQYQDNILQASYLDLVGGGIIETSCAHWYMCDCLSTVR